jgi:hypothetical protein
MVEEDTGVERSRSKLWEGMPSWERLLKERIKDNWGDTANKGNAGSWVLPIAEQGSRNW